MTERTLGKPYAPAFFRFVDNSAAAMDPIAIAETAHSEWIMEQLTAHWSAVPGTSEALTLVKVSVDGTIYDTTLISFNPNALTLQDLVSTEPFRFAKGDQVKISFPNTDSLNVGVEIMLRQVW